MLCGVHGDSQPWEEGGLCLGLGSRWEGSEQISPEDERAVGKAVGLLLLSQMRGTEWGLWFSPV